MQKKNQAYYFVLAYQTNVVDASRTERAKQSGSAFWEVSQNWEGEVRVTYRAIFRLYRLVVSSISRPYVRRYCSEYGRRKGSSDTLQHSAGCGSRVEKPKGKEHRMDSSAGRGSHPTRSAKCRVIQNQPQNSLKGKVKPIDYPNRPCRTSGRE